MHQRDTLYINGNWVAPSGQGKIEVIEASTEQVIGSIPEGEVVAARHGCDKRGMARVTGKQQAGNGRDPGRYRLDEFHKYKSFQCWPVRSAYPASSCST